MKVADAVHLHVDFDDHEALENFEVLYKKELAKSTPSQLSKFRDGIEGDSKIETALSMLKGVTVVNPPKLVVAGLAVTSRSDISIWRLVHSDIMNNIVPRAGFSVCIEGSTGEMQVTLRMSGVFTDEESSTKLLDMLKTAPGILGTTRLLTKHLSALVPIRRSREVEICLWRMSRTGWERKSPQNT